MNERGTMDRTRIATLFADADELGGTTVTVAGWVRSIRDMKNFGFVMLNDGSCFKDLQVVMNRATVANYDEVAALTIHQFFQERGFVYVNTPIITASDAEGAGEMFRVTTLDPVNPPLAEDGSVDWSQDFFGKATNLTVSGQLQAESFALSFGDVYTFGPTFRAEDSNTRLHATEFWMVEPEMAFCDLA